MIRPPRSIFTLTATIKQAADIHAMQAAGLLVGANSLAVRSS